MIIVGDKRWPLQFAAHNYVTHWYIKNIFSVCLHAIFSFHYVIDLYYHKAKMYWDIKSDYGMRVLAAVLRFVDITLSTLATLHIVEII